MYEEINFWKFLFGDLDDRNSLIIVYDKLFTIFRKTYLSIKTFPHLIFEIDKNDKYIDLLSAIGLPEESLEEIKRIDAQRFITQRLRMKLILLNLMNTISTKYEKQCNYNQIKFQLYYNV